MHYALLIALISLVLCGNNTQPSNHASNYAVIVAGSKGFKNYRHQADAFHAYQILRKAGFPEENIILFAYDDVVNDPKNPFKGKMFNNPTGEDVYAGVKIDYREKDVTPANYLKVLRGDKEGMKGIGTGRVLESTSQDNVFLYFSDHGSNKLLAFPWEYLYAPDLIDAIKYMHDNGMYKELVYYLEACHSGSMFLDLPQDINVYATTAASPEESSYAAYCYPQDRISGVHIGSCLGDEYSSKWMEQIKTLKNPKTYTLKEQFEFVKDSTAGSHVMEYGSINIAKARPVADFVFGNDIDVFPKEEIIIPPKPTAAKEQKIKKPKKFKWFWEEDSDDEEEEEEEEVVEVKKEEPKKEESKTGLDWFFGLFNKQKEVDSTINSRDVDLYYLKTKAMIQNDDEAYEEYQKELSLVERSRLIFDKFRKKLGLPNKIINGKTDFSCVKFGIESFKNLCGLDERDIRHLNDITNACTANIKPMILFKTFRDICKRLKP